MLIRYNSAMKFAPYLTPLLVPLDSIVPHPENKRDHPEENLSAIQASLREYGQTRPVLIQRGTRYIIAGNGTWEAAKREGWTKIAAGEFEGTQEQADAYLMVDNRTADMSMFNPLKTIEFIAEHPGLPGFENIEEALRMAADEPEYIEEESERADEENWAIITVRVSRQDFGLFTEMMTQLHMSDEAKAVGKILRAVDRSKL
jgi:ParB-like chromosome segregation protein Spo0J